MTREQAKENFWEAFWGYRAVAKRLQKLESMLDGGVEEDRLTRWAIAILWPLGVVLGGLLFAFVIAHSFPNP